MEYWIPEKLSQAHFLEYLLIWVILDSVAPIAITVPRAMIFVVVNRFEIYVFTIAVIAISVPSWCFFQYTTARVVFVIAIIVYSIMYEASECFVTFSQQMFLTTCVIITLVALQRHPRVFLQWFDVKTTVIVSGVFLTVRCDSTAVLFYDTYKSHTNYSASP